MRYPIDILFLDADRHVLARQTLAPWRFSRWLSKSRGVLELRRRDRRNGPGPQPATGLNLRV